jgi:stearoyl-CoA desaturase (delta-9 desaturase)
MDQTLVISPPARPDAPGLDEGIRVQPAGAAPPPERMLVRRVSTAVLIVGPLVGIGVAIPLLWGRAVTLLDLVLALVLYVVTGHGITVGFHRMFTHRSFRPNRGLKIALGIVGSMAVQGSIVSWTANHRRHHAHSDRPGDPHSPHQVVTGFVPRVRGFLHAHVGWLFGVDDTSPARFAADLLKDRDVVVLDRLFPLVAIGSLALPFLAGLTLTASLHGAVTAFVWAGLVRMALLHHVTWSINSVCHVTGRHPFVTGDRSGNVAVLALASMGESWHNFHHALPSSARHGVGRWELDSSARLIRVFEHLGWASKVHWPSPERIAAARRGFAPSVPLELDGRPPAGA